MDPNARRVVLVAARAEEVVPATDSSATRARSGALLLQLGSFVGFFSPLLTSVPVQDPVLSGSLSLVEQIDSEEWCSVWPD